MGILEMTKSVLIVDDDFDTRRLLGVVIETMQVCTRFATNGLDALESVETETPDLIILDLTMPGMDGYGVLKSLSARPETAGIPVVVHSAVADVNGFEFPSQVVSVLAKPVRPAVLRETVQSAMSGH